MKSLFSGLRREFRRNRRPHVRRLAAETLETRAMLTCTADTCLVNVRLEVTDENLTPVSEVDVGEEFFLRAWVEDLRGGPNTGVFGGYLDVTFDGSLVSVVPSGNPQVSPIIHGPNYGGSPKPGPGASFNSEIDEVGSLVQEITPFGPGETELFRVPFVAESGGEVVFGSNFADVPINQFVLFGLFREVLRGRPVEDGGVSEIEFGSITIDVLEFAANDDAFEVIVGSMNNDLTVLANDTIDGVGGTLTITGVGTPNRDGSASSPDGQTIVYSPAPGFTGTETFTYTISNGQGGTAQAQVVVDVLTPTSVGNFVWDDADGDGIQDASELGVANVRVEIFRAGADGKIGGGDDVSDGLTTTSAAGNYLFENLAPGNYYLQFSNLPAGFSGFTTANVGANDSLDSDVNAGTGRTAVFNLAPGENDLSVDAGLITTAQTRAGRIDATLVLASTPVDTNGQAASLPDNAAWIHEWLNFTVEVWVSTPNGASTGVTGAAARLEYNTDFFTALTVTPGAAFAGDLDATINDAAGVVGLEGQKTVGATVGDDEFVLLARVTFAAISADSGVPINTTVVSPVSPVPSGWLIVADDGSADVQLDAAGAVDVQVGQPPDTDLYPVIYDLDDSGAIGFGDFSIFASAFLRNANESGAASKSDFNADGRVNFGDFSFFAPNFLNRRGSGQPVVFPSSFPSNLVAGFAPQSAFAKGASANQLSSESYSSSSTGSAVKPWSSSPPVWLTAAESKGADDPAFPSDTREAFLEVPADPVGMVFERFENESRSLDDAVNDLSEDLLANSRDSQDAERDDSRDMLFSLLGT